MFWGVLVGIIAMSFRPYLYDYLLKYVNKK